MARWTAHRSRVEEEISRRREAKRFACPVSGSPTPAVRHLYLQPESSQKGGQGDGPDGPEVDEKLAGAGLSPYIRRGYAFPAEAPVTRAKVRAAATRLGGGKGLRGRHMCIRPFECAICNECELQCGNGSWRLAALRFESLGIQFVHWRVWMRR